MSDVFGKKILPQLLIVVVAMLMILEYYTEIPGVTSLAGIAINFRIIIGSIALGLGAIAAVQYHGTLLYKRTPGRWPYSLVLLAGMVTMIITGLMGWYNNPIFSWVWNNVTVPSQQTVYSLLMFYIAFAAYRALRVTNFETAIFTICALAIMVLNAPLLENMLPPIANLGSWIFSTPNVGSARAYTIAATLGSIALYVRTMMGRERGMIGVARGSE